MIQSDGVYSGIIEGYSKVSERKGLYQLKYDGRIPFYGDEDGRVDS